MQITGAVTTVMLSRLLRIIMLSDPFFFNSERHPEPGRSWERGMAWSLRGEIGEAGDTQGKFH